MALGQTKSVQLLLITLKTSIVSRECRTSLTIQKGPSTKVYTTSNHEYFMVQVHLFTSWVSSVLKECWRKFTLVQLHLQDFFSEQRMPDKFNNPRRSLFKCL